MFNVDYEVIENRMLNGLSASAATFAITSVSAFRIGHESGMALKPSKVFKFSAIVGLVAGAIWASMPRAKEKPQDTAEKAKEQVYPAVKVATARILQNQVRMNEEAQRVRSGESGVDNRKKSYSFTPIIDAFTGGSGMSSEPKLMSSEERLAKRYPRLASGFSSGIEEGDTYHRDMPDDEEFISDEELEDMLREEVMSDPFYEGPGSMFNKV